VLAALVAGLSGAPSLRADDGGEARSDAPTAPTLLKVGSSYHLFFGAGLGGSLRLNNPYRLHDELGSTAESISMPPPYASLRLGATVRGTGKLSHGVELDGSFALAGMPQEVLTPSYLALFHLNQRWMFRGRAGIPIVIEPDANAGFEIAAGAVFFGTAALGITADVIGSLFYGAATLDTPRTAIPIASLEIGLVYDYEVLP
jgi:hypothetical protein